MRAIADAPRTIRRWQHWAEPASPVSPLADARVFVLTDRTASACEHLSLALKETGRATLIGATTAGAGHYGGEETFGGGQLQVFIPVGRTYIARTGRGWEGAGIAPDEAVAAREALNQALRDLNVAQTAASAALAEVRAPREVVRVDGAASPTRSYGMGTARARSSDPSLEVVEIAPGFAASRSGLQVGDRIVSINGASVANMAEDNLGRALRASPLVLDVERNGQRVRIEMSLEG